MDRWVLAVDHGTTSTVGATAEIDADDGWVRVATVEVGGAPSVPSVVLSRADGVVLTGHPALAAGYDVPAAAVLRARSHLDTPGGPEQVLTTVGRPTTATDVATAMVATVLGAECRRRGSLPARLVLLHPAGWSDEARGALRRAGRDALGAHGIRADDSGEGDGPVVLVAGPVAAAYRLGAAEPVLVVDLGGGGTEVAVVGADSQVVASRAVAVGGEALDDAMADLVLDRARPDLASRIRYGGDPEAHRAWYALRNAVRGAAGILGASGRVDVPLPGHPSVPVTPDDLTRLLGPALEQVAVAVDGVLADPAVTSLTTLATSPRPVLLARGGLADLAGVRGWLARRTGLTPADADRGALGPHGPVSGAAARVAYGL